MIAKIAGHFTPDALFAPAGIGRYAVAGLANTGAAFCVMIGAMAVGMPLPLANAGGFATGLAVSFLLAGRFTFAGRREDARGLAYAAAFLACYAMNLLVVVTAAAWLPGAVAQILGIGTYTMAFYLACRFWVFSVRSNTA